MLWLFSVPWVKSTFQSLTVVRWARKNHSTLVILLYKLYFICLFTNLYLSHSNEPKDRSCFTLLVKFCTLCFCFTQNCSIDTLFATRKCQAGFRLGKGVLKFVIIDLARVRSSQVTDKTLVLHTAKLTRKRFDSFVI